MAGSRIFDEAIQTSTKPAGGITESPFEGQGCRGETRAMKVHVRPYLRGDAKHVSVGVTNRWAVEFDCIHGHPLSNRPPSADHPLMSGTHSLTLANHLPVSVNHPLMSGTHSPTSGSHPLSSADDPFMSANQSPS